MHYACRQRLLSPTIKSTCLLLEQRYLQGGRSISSILQGVLWVHSAFLSLVTLTFDFWLWHSNSSEWRTKHVFRVNLAQMCSTVLAIHCQIQVPRIERVSPISPIRRVNGRQTITVNYGVSEPTFTKSLHNVDRTSALWTSPSAFPYGHLL